MGAHGHGSARPEAVGIFSFLCIAAIFLAGLAGPGSAAADSPGQHARAILEESGVQGGLVVHLGCGDGRLLHALCADKGDLLLEKPIDTIPAFDVLIAVEGMLLMSTADGRLICFRGRE